MKRLIFVAVEFGNHIVFFLLEFMLGVDAQVAHAVGLDFQRNRPIFR